MENKFGTLSVDKSDRKEFVLLARKTGLKNYTLFRKMVAFYMKNNKEIASSTD